MLDKLVFLVKGVVGFGDYYVYMLYVVVFLFVYVYLEIVNHHFFQTPLPLGLRAIGSTARRCWRLLCLAGPSCPFA